MKDLRGWFRRAATLVTLACVAASFNSAPAAQEPAEGAGLKPSATFQAFAKVTPTHYKIDVAFAPEKHFLRATAAVTLRLEERTESIEFELNRHLTLRRVTDPQGRSLDFIRSGRLTSHKLLVQLAEPAPAASTLTLTFTYDGALPPSPLDYITPDGILLRDDSRWYPATDLAAFTQNRVRITVPANWGAVTTGVMVDSTVAGAAGNAIASPLFNTTRPVSSRAMVGSPLSQVDSREHPALPENAALFTVLLPSHKDQATSLANAARGLHDWLSSWLGNSENALFVLYEAFPHQPGVIGYSAPGFLVVSEDVVKWHGHPGFAPEFLPHEIAHQWFPIEVTLRSEEDGWLAESLAEYLAWRYLEAHQPDHARRMVERAMRNALAHQPLRPLRLGLKLFALEDWDVTHATLYQRGMLVWRTLETVIDRERLDRALREYYARHRGGPASIADFRRICEEISGRDLAWFFDYYINAAELPSITLRRLPSPAPNELAGEIHIANVPPDFQVRVELRVTTAEGVLNHSVATRGTVTPFALNVPAPVTAVELDPRLRILRVTEPARRHRAQIAALQQSPIVEDPVSDADSLRQLITAYQNAIALDPQNLAANHQLYLLHIARLQLRLQDYPAASTTLDRVLSLDSLDPMATDFHRAWACVFRARIALARNDTAAARRAAEAGLALRSPALHSPVAWPDAPDKLTSAAQELNAVLKKR